MVKIQDSRVVARGSKVLCPVARGLMRSDRAARRWLLRFAGCDSGAWAYTVRGPGVYRDKCGRIAVGDSVGAEWTALLAGLRYAASRPGCPGVDVEGSSPTVGQHLAGRVSPRTFRPEAAEAWSILAGLGVPWSARRIPTAANGVTVTLAMSLYGK